MGKQENQFTAGYGCALPFFPVIRERKQNSQTESTQDSSSGEVKAPVGPGSAISSIELNCLALPVFAFFIIAVATCLLNPQAATASGTEGRPEQFSAVPVPVRAVIIQCGSRENIEETCREEPRCCVFLEPAAGEDVAPIDTLDNPFCEFWDNPGDRSDIPVCFDVIE